RGLGPPGRGARRAGSPQLGRAISKSRPKSRKFGIADEVSPAHSGQVPASGSSTAFQEECMHNAVPAHRRRRPRFRFRFAVIRIVPILLAVLVGLSVSTAAFALPVDPLEPPSVDPPDPFIPWPNGFDWNVPSRFGAYRDGIVDYHWDEATHAYDP